jgi:hypothetical protein
MAAGSSIRRAARRIDERRQLCLLDSLGSVRVRVMTFHYQREGRRRSPGASDPRNGFSPSSRGSATTECTYRGQLSHSRGLSPHGAHPPRD